jgi:hypothetical protein
MKNLINDNLDRIENLPIRAPIKQACRERECRCEYKGWNGRRRVRRWLESKVGEKWAHVGSDFVCLEWVPMEKRTFSFLRDFVITDTFMEKGKVYFLDSSPGHGACSEVELDTLWSEIFYVHPETRSLAVKRKKFKKSCTKIRKEEEQKTFRILGDYHQLLKIKGIWYEMKGRPRNQVFSDSKGDYDRYGPSTRFTNTWHAKVFGPIIYSKRQLNSSELKSRNLKND